MTQLTLTVTLAVDGDTDRMAALFAEYLTRADGVFAEDYGRGWGAWLGPFVKAVTVARDGAVVGQSGPDWPSASFAD